MMPPTHLKAGHYPAHLYHVVDHVTGRAINEVLEADVPQRWYTTPKRRNGKLLPPDANGDMVIERVSCWIRFERNSA